MSNWLPFPLLTAFLLTMWLLLVGSMSPGAVLLGGVLALLGSRALLALDPPRTSLRRPRAAVALAMTVLAEIIRSNNAVARIILRPGSQGRRSGFVRIPLDMRNPYGLAILAIIITATPGTLWVEYDSADNSMLLHVLDLVDEEAWAGLIKSRYERRLMEIFE